MKIWHIECSECGFRQRAIQDPKPKRKCPNRHTTCTNSHLDLVHEIEHIGEWSQTIGKEKRGKTGFVYDTVNNGKEQLWVLDFDGEK
jgi:inosine/xanthosine triphosphate pyrophosphatase family protein